MQISFNPAPAREVILTAARSEAPETELKCQTLFELIDTCQSLEAGLRRDLANSELTEHGFLLLAQLVRQEPATLTPGDAAEQLGLSRPLISSLLGRLEISGLITRERNSWDRRSLAVRITAKGRRVFSAALTQCLQSIKRLMSMIEPQEIARLDQTCIRLRQKLNPSTVS